jgi:hypothetical protein
VAHADFIFIESLDHCRREFRQLEALGDIGGRFSCLRGNLFDGVFRLLQIQQRTEAYQYRDILLGDVLLCLGILLTLDAEHGRENLNALLAFLHAAAKLVPRIQSGNASCVGLLACNLQDVSKAVVVKMAHGREIGCECVTLSRLKLLDEEVHIFADEFLRRVFIARRACAVAVAVVVG